VLGWSDWKSNQLVGSLTPHIDKAVMITGRWFSDTLLRSEQPYALATMVACAEQITSRLHEQGVGNGCLEWQLEHQDVDYIQRLFSDYRLDALYAGPPVTSREFDYAPVARGEPSVASGAATGT
jgi:hypothetical protein